MMNMPMRDNRFTNILKDIAVGKLDEGGLSGTDYIQKERC
jgi:hypothetical protein